MLKTNLLVLSIINLLFQGLAFAQVVNINELHDNTTTGVPVLLDRIVTITGEVTVTDHFGSAAYMQDVTGGVAVYDNNFVSMVSIGDYVTISGKVTQYYGLTELKDVTVIEHIPRTPTIEPQVITCQDIQNEGSNGVEHLEGELIRINNVTVNSDNWNVSGSGSNFTLTDATGSCEIRIDADTDIANTVAPDNKKFDVIGVLSQYARNAPFIDGYQLMPRFNEDIVWLTGPRITTNPEEKNITSNSMTICWETATLANSILMYGETDNYEINTVQIDEAVTHHFVQLTDLNPATIYHLKIGSGDDSGTNYSPDYIVITSSHPSSTGEMNVYFNKSVDVSYALPGNETNSNQNLAQKIIDRINAANYSIDLCFYSWNLSAVTSALLNAHNRGVKIRFIHDDDHYYQTQVQSLKNAGIPVIDQHFSEQISYGIQHNKFVIFDARDETRFSDDWIWTGSLNMTDYNNLGVNAAQNVIEIQDQALAKAYTVEFNEMWGSENDTPSAASSLFGANKKDNTPHKFVINNKHVELYFCPSDAVTSKIINAVKSADKEIYFCVLSFTRVDLVQAMQERFTTLGGFQIQGVFDKDQDTYSQWYAMHGEGNYAWNPPADVWLDSESGVLHHKYMIIDAHHPNSDPIIITGSQNWSTSAETKNNENTLIIHDQLIANQYLQEFAKRYHAAGGSSNLTNVNLESFGVPIDFKLKQNYPNPFNSTTIINYQISNATKNSLVLIEIYNLVGQKIKTLVNEQHHPGSYQILWDGLNDNGQKVTSGIYLSSMKVQNKFKATKKLILLE